MAGTSAGGRKAAAKNLANNPNFYRDIGRKGGANGHTGGFAANPELARIAGAKGGSKSRKGKKLIMETARYRHYQDKSGKITRVSLATTEEAKEPVSA